MHITETAVPGAYVFTPRPITDERGTFFESLRTDQLAAAIGRPFTVRQINYSVSRRNTLRGIHSVALPPGQAKYVTCVRGALRDIIVDLRIGSPAFGTHHTTHLEAGTGRALYIPEGVGHGFLALTDDTCVCYVLSSEHVPGTQIDINPLDPELALPWDFDEPPLISRKDTHAPGVSEARSAGLLATWHQATQHTQPTAVRNPLT
ncbi:dTDP-4-dehydrorhamnose 3,5-epimerase family protein [Streptomyces cyaneofuscatus]|uniref:dTDP-4-dehydrorhamnose 3,5-epimerase family protein n=1 Tax=Streptomyces cyaneofuscatus TaxID=66883 RepID=UPI002E0EBDB1|nr:dTDP-4-dehydrorhamnose 3,5-epimerase family protein [Streptomyces cyaneofuscatus]WTF33350.1 dTDP-4-dehydrorhamnose 3,5-epimerase family protein [Streptomyces cyaneofuscatus]